MTTFLSVEGGSDPSIGLAIDWEQPDQHGTMPYAHLREFVTVFAGKMKRYPILYGGHLLREEAAILNGDALLGKCPLWYQRYRETPLGLPDKTWSGYTLWQFDDEHRQNGAPKDILPGADWNRFNGSFDDLKQAWPFSVTAQT
jgi:lysozyme